MYIVSEKLQYTVYHNNVAIYWISEKGLKFTIYSHNKTTTTVDFTTFLAHLAIGANNYKWLCISHGTKEDFFPIYHFFQGYCVTSLH